MPIHTRQELIDYALRKLGSPVIKIELDEEQIGDRVDEALQFFQDFHYDGTERIYLKHKIEGTKVSVASTANFIIGETVLSASGASFTINSISGNDLITKAVFKGGIQNGVFASNDPITGLSSGATSIVISKTVGDIENGCVPISEMVTGVIRAIPWWHATGNSNYVFDPKYQVILATFQNLSSSSMIYYSQLMSHISLMDQVLRPIDSIRFNRKTNKIYLDFDWTDANIGSYLVFEVYRILDPEEFNAIYNDRMLKKLVTAKLKYQWAHNLQKYSGVQLLGGVTVNADALMSQAVAEIESAESEIRDSYELPAIGFLS